MNIPLDSTKKILLSAVIGAAVTYGALSLTSNETTQRQQITLLEARIEGLEALLTQKEEQLTNTHFMKLGVFEQNDSMIADQSLRQAAAPAANGQPGGPGGDITERGEPAPDREQVRKDLMTLFVGDPRSFSEKVNDFIASNPSRENIVIASESIFNLADNLDMLPDHSLQSMYMDQTDADIRRVVAQVASMRGDNSLIDMQINEAQASLKSANPAERQKALIELAKTRYVGAANIIAPLLQDNDIGVKLDALLALRATGNQSHIRLVEGLVNDPNDSVSWLANDVINNLQNLSDRARTRLASADIVAELPVALGH